MKNIYITFFIFSCMLLFSCSKDEGNYDYHDINELGITGVASSYSVRTDLDTLKIKPTITATMDDGDTTRYQYLWMLKLGTKIDTISRSRNLVYPVKIEPVQHNLYYRVLDLKTGVTWRASATLTVGTVFSRGILIMGEDEQGFAEAEMLAMQNDTLHIKGILAKSGLPRLREPLSFLHTGSALDAYVKLWAFTKSGSYYMDRIKLTASPDNIFSKTLFVSEQYDPAGLQPMLIAPQIRTVAGLTGSTLYRAVRTTGGDIFACMLPLNGGDFYNNAINRVATAQEERLPSAPYLMYPILSMSSFVWYDTKNQRFLNYATIGSGLASTVLTDQANGAFPWNQPAGRTLVYAENTKNTDDGSSGGNSFAIMKDATNMHVYKFYASGSAPAKRAAYVIKPVATDFGKADFYAFSSTRTVIFYSVKNKLYAYDYNPGNEKAYSFPEIGADEITMLKFDTQNDATSNSLYIATYNAATKGTLRRYRVGTNPNVVELLPQDKSTWSGLVKVKDINWRAVN